MGVPTFPKRDPADAEFWELRWQARFVPWDAGRVPAQLAAFAASRGGSPRVLVPGCGSAHEVAHLAALGWDVLGLDFSTAAVAAARAQLGPHADRIREGDFFAPIAEAPFAGIYERAFLCALPRRLWPAWGARVAELVEPGGWLLGYFYFDEGERGPPFPLASQAELDGLLAGAFERVEDAAVPDSIPFFVGKERWQAWRRR
jgi:SAM-dependent methyltransferase